jgi:hypothetical protein
MTAMTAMRIYTHRLHRHMEIGPSLLIFGDSFLPSFLPSFLHSFLPYHRYEVCINPGMYGGITRRRRTDH